MDIEKNYTSTTDLDVKTVPVRRITWGAIFAGALVMLVIMMLLSLLGIGIGLGAINPLEDQAFEGLGTGAIIWWILSNLIAVFFGGYVTGRLMNYSYKGGGILHGIVAWSLFTVVSFLLLSTAIGTVFSGVGSVVTKSVSTIGSGAELLVGGSEEGQGQNLFNLEEITNGVLSGGESGDASQKQYNIESIDVLKQVFFENGKLNTDIQREEVVDALAQNSNLTQQQVNEVADEVMNVYGQAVGKWQEVKQEASQTAEKVTSAASTAAIWSFVALLIGALMAGFGGYIGRPKEYYSTIETDRIY